MLYISRTITESERNYSNIEREALVAYWSSKRLENFLLGKQFTLKTDCKPLTYILSPSQAHIYTLLNIIIVFCPLPLFRVCDVAFITPLTDVREADLLGDTKP